jgi:hypothetical protein
MKKFQVDKQINRAMELRKELFDIANSFAGDETGDIAIMLHESCNWILRAKQTLELIEKK